MAGSIDIIGPAAIAALNGTSLLSLDTLPPDGIAISDSNSGAAIRVTLIASAADITLSASSAGGAGISSNGGTLTISGTEIEVNAALASLALTSSAALSGVLSMSVADNQGAAKSTSFGLVSFADPPLAFVAPPGSFASELGYAAPLTGLTLAADGAAALALLGAAPEMMNLTLISTTAPLLLDPASAAGIAVSGDASETLVLAFTSTELPQLNVALAAINLVNAGGTLEYIARELSGPLTPVVTFGSLSYAPDGISNQNSETWLGGNGLWQSGGGWSGGFAPGQTGVSIAGAETITGFGAASVMTLAAGANLALSAEVAVSDSLVATNATLDLVGSAGAPAALSALDAHLTASSVLIDNAALSIQNSLVFGTQSSVLAGTTGTLEAGSLILDSGASLTDFGSLGGGAFDLGTGANAFLPGGEAAQGSLGNSQGNSSGGGVLDYGISMASGAVIDFAGLLEAGASFGVTNAVGFTLAAGAIIEGAGTLVSGNFSESGVIDGPGTILALGPAPLTIAAGSISGGAQFVIDPGAVLELGAVSPLYGVFNPTPLSIDSSVTVNFAPGANPTQDTGLYPSGRGEQGGVLLLDYPGQFAGTINNFAPGDRIALPSLTNLSLSNLTGTSFVVSGTDANGVFQSDTIHAAYSSGLSPFVETDINSNNFIGLRGNVTELTLNDVPAVQATVDAVSGYQELINGLGLLLPTSSPAALSLTISPVTGLIGDSSNQPASTITLTGSTALDLNNLLGTLVYTSQGSGSGDTLRFTGAGGGLNGFSAAVAVSIAAPATLDYQGGAQGQFSGGASWSGGNAPANGDVAVFGSHAGAAYIINGFGEAGGMTVTGAYDFAGTVTSSGTSSGQNGTALTVDGNGTALFDANAVVSLPGFMTIGDGGGAGTAGVAGSLSAGLIDIAGNANAAGSMLDVSGSLTSTGPLAIGGYASGTLDLTGSMRVAQTTIGSAGLLNAAARANAGLGAVTIAGGTLGLSGGAIVSVGSLTMSAGSVMLGDQAAMTGGSIIIAGGTLNIGAAASASAQVVSIAAGAVLNDAGSIDATGFALTGAAVLTNGAHFAAGTVSLSSAASLSLDGGVLTATGLTIASGAALAGFGEIGGTSLGVLPSIAANGALTASGGTLTLGGDVTGNVTIGPGGVLDLVHGATGGTISFTGINETLIINDVGVMQDTVTGMVAGDAIELVGVPAGSVSIAGGAVSIADPSSFGFAPAAGQPSPQVTGNGTGGSTITMGSEMPCFARGTMLLTPAGYRPVEALIPGDTLITESGAARGIVWIGSRVIDLATDPAAAILRPVVIAAAAFGKGMPLRKLRLSPLHAVFAEGVLVPAVLLVNGATITRDDTVQAVTYYHVELARHDVVRAEGLEVETYRDTGNRRRFAEARGVPGLPVPAYAPLITGGAALARVRRALHERALTLGYRLAHRPDLQIWAGKTPLALKFHAHSIELAVPDAVDTLRLTCRPAVPAETDPGNQDRRALGICIGAMQADGQALLWNNAAPGWHTRAASDQGRWSTGEASLILPHGTREFSAVILGTVPAWLAPSSQPVSHSII